MESVTHPCALLALQICNFYFKVDVILKEGTCMAELVPFMLSFGMRIYCRGPLYRLCMGISERSGAVESWEWMGLSCIKILCFPRRLEASRGRALHPCPHATVHWSPMGAGTRQYKQTYQSTLIRIMNRPQWTKSV